MLGSPMLSKSACRIESGMNDARHLIPGRMLLRDYLSAFSVDIAAR